MRKCMTARTQFIATAVFVVAALAALVTGLTLGLQTPALEDGGSPTLPPELLTTAAAGGDGDVPGETTEEPTGSGYLLHLLPEHPRGPLSLMAKDLLENLVVPQGKA